MNINIVKIRNGYRVETYTNGEHKVMFFNKKKDLLDWVLKFLEISVENEHLKKVFGAGVEYTVAEEEQPKKRKRRKKKEETQDKAESSEEKPKKRRRKKKDGEEETVKEIEEKSKKGRKKKAA